MSFKWQAEHMTAFLEAYKKNECLWNNKCTDYSKTSARDNAYELMLSDLNLPGLTILDIKAKIKTIRTRYVAELTKVRSSEKEAAADSDTDIYVPRLFWFKRADKFLRDVVLPKPMKGKDPTETSFLNHYKQENNPDADNDCSTSVENTRQSPVVSHVSHQTRSKRLSNNPSDSKPSKRLKQTTLFYDNNDEHRNEFDVFCESLAIQLKKMPLQRAVICQENLQRVMTQERLYQLSELEDNHRNFEESHRSGTPNSEREQSVRSVPLGSQAKIQNNQQVSDEEDNKTNFIPELHWDI